MKLELQLTPQAEDSRQNPRSAILVRVHYSALLALVFSTLTGINACTEDINLDPKAGTTVTSTTTTTTEDETTTTTNLGTTTTTSDDTTTTTEDDSTTTTTSSTTTTTASGSALSDDDDEDSGPDSDNDQLSDYREGQNATDPNDPDSDNDGFTDGFEVETGSNPLDSSSVPSSARALALPKSLTLKVSKLDSDGDGVPNTTEEARELDSTSPDTDQDGVYDGIELLHGSDPKVANDPIIDADGDGLSDQAEGQLGTNPALPDTDRDELIDPLEILLSFDPRDPDSDDDGVLDGWEGPGQKFRFATQTFQFDN